MLSSLKECLFKFSARKHGSEWAATEFSVSIHTDLDNSFADKHFNIELRSQRLVT